jgi:hypothetical protein
VKDDVRRGPAVLEDAPGEKLHVVGFEYDGRARWAGRRRKTRARRKRYAEETSA